MSKDEQQHNAFKLAITLDINNRNAWPLDNILKISHGPSEIILILSFGAQETFIIIKVENSLKEIV